MNHHCEDGDPKSNLQSDSITVTVLAWWQFLQNPLPFDPHSKSHSTRFSVQGHPSTVSPPPSALPVMTVGWWQCLLQRSGPGLPAMSFSDSPFGVLAGPKEGALAIVVHTTDTGPWYQTSEQILTTISLHHRSQLVLRGLNPLRLSYEILPEMPYVFHLQLRG